MCVFISISRSFWQGDGGAAGWHIGGAVGTWGGYVGCVLGTGGKTGQIDHQFPV